MNASDVQCIVTSEVEGFTYEPTAPGSTVGVPWSEEKVRSHLPKLRAALVKPYLRRFVLRDTWEQHASVPILAEYWVVAETDSYIEFFDPAKKEFGLASSSSSGEAARTIGVRGDLVGVFCAM